MKVFIIWVTVLCCLLKVAQHFRGSACYLLHTGFLLDLFLDPEDGASCFFESLVDFQQTTERCIPDERTLQLKS
jgi:hypothetical protein